MLDGLGSDHRLDVAQRLSAMLDPIRIGPEFRIIYDCIQAGDAAELAPEVVVGHPDHDRSVRGLEGLVWAQRLVAGAALGWLRPPLPEGLEIIAQESKCRVEQRYLDHRALARLLSRKETSQDTAKGMNARHLIDRRDGAADIAAALVTRHRHDAAEGLKDHVVARGILQRSRPAEAGDAAMDQPGIQRAKARRIDAQPLGDAGAKAFDRNVGGLCK